MEYNFSSLRIPEANQHLTTYQRIIHEWSGKDHSSLNDQSILSLFEEQVAKTPHHIALSCDGIELSYEALHAEAEKLAYCLRADYSVKPRDLVGIMLDRSEKMIIALLGVLKAGAAYVCIDTDYPAERKKYIMEDASLNVLVTQSDGIFDLEFYTGQLFAIDLQLEFINEKNDLSPIQVHPEDPAYVIYTSGTTGNPKGVIISHRAVVSLVVNDYLHDLLDKDNFAFLSSPLFDASTFEIYTPLLRGNKLIIPKALKNLISNVAEFKLFLESNGVSALWLTKTLFDSLFYLDPSLFASLNYLLIGGEALDKQTVNRLIASEYKPAHFMNGYGPTESTTFTCVYHLLNRIDSPNVPIGKPIDNRSVYILDSERTPVDVGVTGELYIGGAGLATGYLNRPELNSERFVPNPFASEADKLKGYTTLYRSGDLVRWLPDGNIEYIGRNDDQVKIRGFRIELGEIENALAQMDGIRRACVLVKTLQSEAGVSNYLSAYYEAEENTFFSDNQQLLAELAKTLPEYMIPATLIRVDTFPVTANGKLDKQALLSLETETTEQDHVAPTTETEKEVCHLWEEVLGVQRVGLRDNFFRIGGSSILAIQLAHRMSILLKCDLKISDILKLKTVEMLLAEGIRGSRTSIPQAQGDTFLLSFSQERLWFIEQFEEGMNAYHIPYLYELDRDTDAEGLKHALQQIIQRHEVLRSTIVPGERATQKVHQQPLMIREISFGLGEDHDTAIREEIGRPFDLVSEYPVRVVFYNIATENGAAEGKRLLLINKHHIASDGWSEDIFQKELLSYYEAYQEKQPDFRLAELPIQYKDYAAWQRSHLSEATADTQLNYWKQKLSGYQELDFPTDHARPVIKDYRGSQEHFKLDKQLSQKLRDLALTHEVSLNSILFASFNILLSKYSGQLDIVTGTVNANRAHEQLEQLIGFFVNTQANRVILDPGQSFMDLAHQIQQDQTEAQANQDVPFERLVDELHVKRDLSRHPIFQVMFGLQNFGKIASRKKDYFKPYHLAQHHETEQFDLSVFFDDAYEEISCEIGYATSLFKQETIARLMQHYHYLLEQIAALPQALYSSYSLLRQQELDRMIYEWNETSCNYPQDKTIQALFKEQVEQTPEAIALVFEDQALSYRTLHEKSNQLARHIRHQYRQRTQKELQAGSRIALCFERSLEMIISILAVLKAGGAYVPMDPDAPQEHLDYLIRDSGAELILSKRDTASTERPSESFRNRVVYSDLSENLYQDEDLEDLPEYSAPHHLAYVIYTSGTTGKPKGVQIEQHAVLNLTAYHNKRYVIFSEQLHVALLSSYNFDFSVQPLFTALLNGHRLHLPSETLLLDPPGFSSYLERNRIASFEITPTLFAHLILPLKDQLSKDLKMINIGGEALNQKLVTEFSQRKNAHLISVCNTYGPTECTVDAALYEIDWKDHSKQSSQTVLIGKPIDNTQLYVLDTSQQPVPVGVAGELCIAGSGVARGYLNLPELTQASFIPNPFYASIPEKGHGKRLYRTGDLVKWHTDGNLEYIGRNDNQVKIRGYRVEPGEIENTLLKVPGISQCCVTVKDRKTSSGNMEYLVAYYICEKGCTIKAALIQDILSQQLPDHMVPDAFMELDALPLTTNGKLNRLALPEPEFNALPEYYAAPRTETEKTLCHIWEQSLGLQAVGISDNFFRIGGNSILAIQVSHRISRALNIDIKVADIFRHPTCEKLALYTTTKHIIYVEGEL